MSTNKKTTSHSRSNHKLHLAVLAALPLLVLAIPAAYAVGVTSPIVPVGASSNGANDATGGVGGVSVHGYTGGTVTLGDGTAQTITGGFLPRVVQGNNNDLINSGTFVVGRKYFIQTLGTTDFTALGAASNVVGESFIATATGTGTGVATDSANVIGGYNSLDHLNLIVTANTTLTPATVASVLVEDDVIEGLITKKTYSIAAMTNGGSSITNSGNITNIDGGQVGNATAIQSTNVAVQLGNDGDSLTVKSGGTVSAAISTAKIAAMVSGTASAPNTAKAYGVNTDAAGDYAITVEHGGSISASHAGVGGAYAIDGGGNSQSLTVDNSGTISGARINPLLASSLTGSNVLATALKAKLNSGNITLDALSAQSVGNVAAIYVQEELESLTVNNTATGVLETSGDLTDTLYVRAIKQDITNEGKIRVNGYTASNKNGMAIASVSDSMRLQSLTLDNRAGTITGDIAVVSGNALRYWVIKKYGVAGDELKINSGAGQIDSVIANSGTITGDFYYSNGTHSLTNDGGTITGNINIDQRDTVCGSGTASGQTCALKNDSVAAHLLADHLEYAGGGSGLTSVSDTNTANSSYGGGKYDGNFTLHGTKEFTFENNGTFIGNVTITTVGGLTGNYTNVYGQSIAKENSNVTLIPTITGSGVGSTLAAPSEEIAGMGNVLTIVGAGAVTVAPKASVTVHAGEYFKVAGSVVGATPLVDSANTPLVNWNIRTNDSGNLVVGVDSLNKASTIAGVTARDAEAIDALLEENSTSLGAKLQSPTTSVADLKKAGQQLRPEANNASTQAAMSAVNQVSSVIGMHQDQVRTASNGNSGVSTGEAAQGVGFWMEGFGFKGDQNQRGGVDGYSASTGGFVFGADKAIGDGDLRLGAALAYGTTTANRTNIDSYQGNVYGSWNAGTWYVDAALGYGQHQYKTKRYVALAGANMSGNHDADQYSAKIGVGYPMALGGVTLTPLAALSYVHLDQAGYRETDATNSGAALIIGDTKTDSFRSGLGAKVSLPLSSGTVKTALEAHGIWNHEFADTNQNIVANFVGGTTFTTAGINQARDSANLGLGLSMNSTNGQTLSVNYDADVRSSYVGHTASMKFRYDF